MKKTTEKFLAEQGLHVWCGKKRTRAYAHNGEWIDCNTWRLSDKNSEFLANVRAAAKKIEVSDDEVTLIEMPDECASFDGIKGQDYTKEELAEIKRHLPGGDLYDPNEWF